VDRPETRYVVTPDGVTLAYQRFGHGDVDLVYVPYFLFNVDLLWDFEPIAAWLSELATFARVIVHDPRGIGLSDRGPEPGDLGTRMRDLLTILDAEGVDRVSLLGSRSYGGLGALLAATRPDRVDRFIWLHAVARERWAEDYPWGSTLDEEEAELEQLPQRWGSASSGEEAAIAQGPMGQVDHRFQEWMARVQRGSVTPSRAVLLVRTWFETDVRDVLPSVTVPTLVLARQPSAEQARYVASRIPTAHFQLLAGFDDMPWFGDTREVLDAIQDFLGVEPVPEVRDRALATVLFTDIVASTSQAARLGDSRWNALVAEHLRLLRDLFARFGGTEMDTTGDGVFATFDSPGGALECAVRAVAAVQPLGIEIRAGVHTGEVLRTGIKDQGIAVAIGARVCALAGASEVLATRTVKDLSAGAGLSFTPMGDYELKGVPDTWTLYRVTA